MNKKLISMALTGVLAVGMLSVATPSVADARKTKPETSTDISHQYKMKIDVITGNASDMEEGGKPKKVIGEIFNKDKVIESTQAERVAKQQLGNDAVMKGWKIEAHNGKVLYYVTMHQDGKKVVVTVDAETGAYVEQSKSYKLPPEPDQGFDGRKTNLVWGSDIDMGR